MKLASHVYESGGVRLRPLEAGDLSHTLAWRNRDGVRQCFIDSTEIGEAAHRQWFDRYLQKPDDLVFIAEDLPGGQRIGQLAIYRIDSQNGVAEVGRFVAAPEQAGKGKMRMALQALLSFAYADLGLTRVYLEVLSTNARAIALYESLGFKRGDFTDGLVRMDRELV